MAFAPQTPLLDVVKQGQIMSAIRDVVNTYTLRVHQQSLQTQKEVKKEREEEQPYTSPSSETSKHKAELMKHGYVVV